MGGLKRWVGKLAGPSHLENNDATQSESWLLVVFLGADTGVNTVYHFYGKLAQWDEMQPQAVWQMSPTWEQQLNHRGTRLSHSMGAWQAGLKDQHILWCSTQTRALLPVLGSPCIAAQVSAEGPSHCCPCCPAWGLRGDFSQRYTWRECVWHKKKIFPLWKWIEIGNGTGTGCSGRLWNICRWRCAELDCWGPDCQVVSLNSDLLEQGIGPGYVLSFLPTWVLVWFRDKCTGGEKP